MDDKPTEERPIRAGELSKQPTLLKLASHARWFIEKSGVDAERCYVTIGTESVADARKIMDQIEREFAAGLMRRVHPKIIDVVGVKIGVFETKPTPPKETA